MRGTSVDEADKVYRKSDARREHLGVIISYKGKRKGVKVFDVAWIGSGRPVSEHLETELVAAHANRRVVNNTINGPVTGTAYQTGGDIHGPVTFDR